MSTDTGCVVVGGGPGGMMTAYLLARCGIPVTLLESHGDFDRDFRGDSLHPYTLELLDTLGLADDLLALPHFPAQRFRMHTPTGTITTADYGRLRTRFPYVALMPQARFLDFMADRAAALPTFTLRTGARVRSLDIDDAGRVRGVRWRGGDGEHVLRAALVIAADGRFSTVRRLADLPAVSLGASSDLLWFRLPRHVDDPPEADVDLYFGSHHYAGLLGGVHDWQIGLALPKGGYPAARAAGTGPIRDFLRRHVDWLGDRIDLLTDFSQCTLLSVDIARVRSWHRPGLLLIGDAAHVISPVGGNGILMAVQDAVAATNRLVSALRTGHVTDRALAAVQRAREPAVVAVQAQQVRIERRSSAAREAGRPLLPTRLLRVLTALPGARTRAARANAYGPHPPALDTTLLDHPT